MLKREKREKRGGEVYPEAQLLKPHSMQMLHPSVMTSRALHDGQVVSSFEDMTCIAAGWVAFLGTSAGAGAAAAIAVAACGIAPSSTPCSFRIF